jgi:hypothetical protein
MDAMERFTRQYAAMSKIDLSDLAYWDLYAATRPAFKIAEWAGDDVAERRMRDGHRLFITQAFDRLMPSPGC